MRVRTFELRLIALVLAACWAVAAGVVLVAYRPGGPIDVAVGVAALLPAVVALAGVAWPPLARGERAFAAIVCLAAGSLLVLVPSIADVTGQLGGRGVQTLLPSGEAAYPWVLALLGTSLFSGFGIARRRLGEAAMRRRRLVRGIALAAVLAAGSGLVFSAVAMGNELALRDRIASSSRFGPTDPDREPPECDGPMGIGPAARVGVHFEGSLDGRSLGTIDLAGERSVSDVRWLAYVATSRDLGLHGATSIGIDAWIRDPVAGWRRATTADVRDATLDVLAFRVALSPAARAAAQSSGVGLIEGARGRQCRIQVDGPTFRAAFPEVTWLVGTADLARWRGHLDYWVFADGQIGRIAGSVNGDAADIREGALQATIRVDLTATDRDATVRITPPGP
ncbi:MAG TPA: hypothetical protein VFY18_00710 [Candidatus Limnocylindrales bacterium]|nr:hypothetical protein [Candidatus Limnocylindrales bacterium]